MKGCGIACSRFFALGVVLVGWGGGGGLWARCDAREGREEEFTLRHVVPAKEALVAHRQQDMLMAAKLFAAPLGLYDRESRKARVKLAVQTREEYMFRMGRGEPFSAASQFQPYFARLPALLPRPEDHDTVLGFANMSADSYVARAVDDWRNATEYGDADSFGWNSTGLRGHVFVNKLHTIVVISFKGTSTILHGGETVARDKYMDNVMFSCCCARVDPSWTPVCGCYQGNAAGQSLCDKKCLADVIRSDKDSYYHEALAVAQLVILKYPKAQLWFTGHSLGGAIAALMAVRIRRTAAITFASPGPYYYARHLGLDTDEPGSQWRYPVWNFGITSDPIFMGTCTGFATSCYLSGYAMETACRHGMDCVYQVSSWQPDVSTHRIDWFIDHVISNKDKYPLPSCLSNRNCTDCQHWLYV